MWPFRRRDPPPPPSTPDRDDATPRAGRGVVAVSVLPPETVAALGHLPPLSVAAFREPAPGGTGEVFRANPAFVALLHDVVRREGPADPAMRAAAARQGEGWVYVIDLRTPDGPGGRVPPVDIVGGFRVEGGAVVPDSYWPNDAHLPATADGVVDLGPSLNAALRRAASGSPPPPDA